MMEEFLLKIFNWRASDYDKSMYTPFLAKLMEVTFVIAAI